MDIGNVMAGAVDSMRKSADNLAALQEAKRKRQQEDEILKLNKQEMKIKLQKAAAEGKTNDLQNQMLELQMKEYFKQQEDIAKGKAAEINQVELQEKNRLNQAGGFVKNVAQSGPEGRSLVLQTINPALAPPREAFNAQGEQIMSYPGQDQRQAVHPSAAPTSTPTPISVPTGKKSVFEEPIKPRLQIGKDRMSFERVEEKPKEFFIRRIQEKKAQGIALTPDEEALWRKEILGQSGSSVDTSDLTGSQEVQARSLAKKLYTAKGMEQGLPGIIKLMREGKTVDQIEDEIRLGGQSEAMAGPIRDAAQQILITMNPNTTQQALDFIDDKVTNGDIEDVKSLLKKTARDSAGAEDAKAINGKERTLKFLGEIQDDLNTLEINGVNTNIFSGTLEDINAKIGRVNNPELRKVATKIKTAIQNYRKSLSGSAFSVPEAAEYKDIFPSIGRTSNFNTANIQALQEVMRGDLDTFYSLSMGEKNYKKLFSESSNNGYKVGDTRVIDGVTYTRDENGQWRSE